MVIVRTKLSATKTEARLNEHANIVIGTEAQRSLMNMLSDCTGRLRINKCSSVAEITVQMKLRDEKSIEHSHLR